MVGTALGRSGIEALLEGLENHRLIEIIALDDTLYAVTVIGRRVRMHAVGQVGVAEREVDLARFMLRRLAYGRPALGSLPALHEAGRRLERVLLGPAVSDLDGGPVVVVPPGRLHAVPWGLLPSLRGTSVRVAPSAATWLRRHVVDYLRLRRALGFLEQRRTSPAAPQRSAAG